MQRLEYHEDNKQKLYVLPTYSVFNIENVIEIC